MAYIHVDIDLDEIDMDDLVMEISRRYNRKWNTEKEKAEIRRLFKECLIEEPPLIKCETIIDQMKFDLIKDNFHKFNLDQFENFLKTL